MKARLMRRLALTMVAVGGPLFSQALVWQRTNGPYKATVRALAITSQDELLAGTDGGLYRSSDNGATWKLESLAGLFWTHQEPQVNAILANPAGLLIVGEEYGGIVRSADDGASWTRSDFPYESHVRSLASTNSDVLYAGTYQDGMYRSTDLGLSWHKTSVTSPSVSCLYVDPEGQIYGGADGAIIRSTDDGGRWEYASIQAGSVRSIQMSPNGLLFAGAWGGGLFISTDKGTTWNARNQNIPRLDIDALAFDSTGNFYAGITVTGLYRSVDEGLSWTRVGFTNEDVFSLLVIRSNTLVTGSFLGIHISADAGATFEEKNIGLMNTYPTVLVNTTTGSMFATLNGRGLYRSLDGGSDWTRLWTEDVGGITADARGNVYVGKDNGIWKSSDNGDDWTTLQVPFFPYVITVDDNVISVARGMETCFVLATGGPIGKGYDLTGITERYEPSGSIISVMCSLLFATRGSSDPRTGEGTGKKSARCQPRGMFTICLLILSTASSWQPTTVSFVQLTMETAGNCQAPACSSEPHGAYRWIATSNCLPGPRMECILPMTLEKAGIS